MFDPISAIADAAKGIVDKIVPDQNAKIQYQQKIEELKSNGELAQLDAVVKWSQAQTQINLVDAQSSKWWQAGWRPFLGWTCGGAFVYNFILRPLLVGSHLFPDMPQLDVATLSPVLMGMLGLAGMRTVEKLKNAD